MAISLKGEIYAQAFSILVGRLLLGCFESDDTGRGGIVRCQHAREKAEATFKDPRFVTFLKNVQDGFKVSCTAPDPDSTNAKITLPKPITKDAPPDAAGFASTWYEVAVPCSGETTVTVVAEFVPLHGNKPLTLVLSLRQVLKR